MKNHFIHMSHVRLRAPLLFFVIAALIFSLQRLGILLFLSDRFTENFTTEILRSLIIGLRFDIVIAGMLTVPIWLIMVPAPLAFIYHRLFKACLAIYSALALMVVVLVNIVDFYFFQEFNEHLNHKAIHYLKYDYVHKIIVDQFPVIPATLAAGISCIIFFIFFYKKQLSRLRGQSSFVKATTWSLIVGALLALGIRSSIGPKAINTGPAYFSHSSVLAQLSLNAGFTLREAIISLTDKAEDLSQYYSLLSEQQALRITRELVTQPQDTFVDDPLNPLHRVTDTGLPQQKYNVVLVILESLSWHYIGAMGGKPDLTPNLSRLANEGILFDQCYAVGKRTTRGFSGIVAGFPDLPGDSVTTRTQAEGKFLTLGRVLQQRDYETMFIYAGQPFYDHRQAFLGSNGYSRFVFEDEFTTRHFKTHLGWSDEDLFNTAHSVFDRHDPKQPFFATLLTLSFHRPYELPVGRVEPHDPSYFFHKQIDAVRYVDWTIGQFMDKAKKADYFDNTLFVFTADHFGGFKEGARTAATFRVPFIIYAPDIFKGQSQRISKTCSQTDIAPTIMSLLGGKYEHSFFGSDVFTRPAQDSVALIQNSFELYLVDGDKNVVTMPPYQAALKLFKLNKANKVIVQNTKKKKNKIIARDLSQKAIAILQTANILFERESYNIFKR